MLARAFAGTVVGITGRVIQVEVDLARGLPGVTIVGLPDASIKESRERIRSAIRNSGLKFPLGRITVNLAPAQASNRGEGIAMLCVLALVLEAIGVARGMEPGEPSASRQALEAAQRRLADRLRGPRPPDDPLTFPEPVRPSRPRTRAPPAPGAPLARRPGLRDQNSRSFKPIVFIADPGIPPTMPSSPSKSKKTHGRERLHAR